jgi:ABC-2 type transport system ATP-binding protein
MSEPTPRDAAIRMQGLNKVFRTGLLRRRFTAVESLDLEVPHGGIFGFIGHNGAGKTTTIKLLMGLARPTAGTATVLGRPVGDPAALARIGFLPERPYFYDYLTGREFLDFYGRLFGLDAATRRRRSERLLDTVKLSESADDQLRTYSKGMLQRIGMAQALINDPQLVVLDEPMSGLDPAGRRLIRNVILDMRDDGRTVFFSSHILSDVEMICERIGILVRGRLHYTGGVADLLERQVNRVEVRAEGLPEDAPETLEHLAERFDRHGNQWLLRCGAGEPATRLLAALTELDATIVSVTPLRPSLEDLFVRELDGSAPTRTSTPTATGDAP